MEEIKSSFEKIFDQFASDNESYKQPNRLSSQYIGSVDPISKKRKLSTGTVHNSRLNKSITSNHDDSTERTISSDTSFNITSNASVASSPFEIRRLKADVIDYNSRIAQMKQEIETRAKTHVHMEEMYTTKVKQLQKQVDIGSDKVREMDKHLKLVRKREAAQKLELVKTKNNLAQQKRVFDDHISQLQFNNINLEEALRQTHRELTEKITELNNQYNQMEQKFICARDELESLEQNTAQLLEQGNKYNALETQHELQTRKLEATQRRVENLEEEIVAFGDWKKQSKTNQGRINKIPDLEKLVETLKRENKNLNDNIGNKLLLEEQVHDLKTRLEKKERSNDDHVALQTHIKALEAELLEYKSVASDHCPPKTAVSASNLRECIETILQKDVIRTSEKGTTKTENDSASTEMLDLKKQIEDFTKANSDLQTSLKLHKTSLHRVQKKLMLVAKERECYKQLIDSYEKDLTITTAASDINPDVQLRMKLDMVERSLTGYKELCADQEKQLLASRSLPDSGLSSTFSEAYERFKKDLEVLRQENERLRRRKEELELMVEQIYLKGAYNLENKYKIVHMSANPNTEAQEKHQNEVEKLQAENERLRRKNAKLQQNNEEITRVNETMNITNDLKELSSLREQLVSLERKNKQLKEYFKSTSDEFRTMVYLMFGFKVTRVATGMYKISSLYAESENEVLNFQLSESGDLQLIESDYSNTLADMIHEYLGEQASVPLFLSNLTIQLFNNQTMA